MYLLQPAFGQCIWSKISPLPFTVPGVELAIGIVNSTCCNSYSNIVYQYVIYLLPEHIKPENETNNKLIKNLKATRTIYDKFL